MDETVCALLLTLGAGLFTAIGGAVVYTPWLNNITDKRFLAGSLGFATGVMVYISFTELFTGSVDGFIKEGYTKQNALLNTSSCFFGGVGLVRLIDVIVYYISPHEEVMVEQQSIEDGNTVGNDGGGGDEKLYHTGVMTALAIVIHNFPEGMATFMSGTVDVKMGATLAIAVAIHNIPEGVCVATPIYYSTGDKNKAFLIALLSGLAEPLGALVSWLVLYKFMSNVVYAGLFGVVSGIMVYISLTEMFPIAHSYIKKGDLVSNCLIAGFFVMSLSLILF